MAQGVADRLGEAGFAGDPLELGRQPGLQGVDDRAAVLAACGEALVGRAAADLRLDGVEPADLLQGLEGDRRLGRLVAVVEVASAVRPAEGEPHRAAGPVAREALEAAVAVDLQDAGEAGQMRRRSLALAILGIDIGHRRRCGPLPGSVIDRIGPQPAGLGPAAPRIEHRQRRVVGEDLGRAQDPAPAGVRRAAPATSRPGRPSR